MLGWMTVVEGWSYLSIQLVWFHFLALVGVCLQNLIMSTQLSFERCVGVQEIDHCSTLVGWHSREQGREKL